MLFHKLKTLQNLFMQDYSNSHMNGEITLGLFVHLLHSSLLISGLHDSLEGFIEFSYSTLLLFLFSSVG